MMATKKCGTQANYTHGSKLLISGESPEELSKSREEMKPNSLVIIRYYDHVEFRNKDYSKLKPILREVVGWIAYEEEDYIILLSEKPASDKIEEIAKLKPSGFVILKKTIKEVINLDA